MKFRVEGSFEGRPADAFEIHADSAADAWRVAEKTGITVSAISPAGVSQGRSGRTPEPHARGGRPGNEFLAPMAAVLLVVFGIALAIGLTYLSTWLRARVAVESTAVVLVLIWAVVTLVVHGAFAACVARHAGRRQAAGEEPELLRKWWWVGAVFLGGLPAAGLYWLVNGSGFWKRPRVVRDEPGSQQAQADRGTTGPG